MFLIYVNQALINIMLSLSIFIAIIHNVHLKKGNTYDWRFPCCLLAMRMEKRWLHAAALLNSVKNTRGVSDRDGEWRETIWRPTELSRDNLLLICYRYLLWKKSLYIHFVVHSWSNQKRYIGKCNDVFSEVGLHSTPLNSGPEVLYRYDTVSWW